MKKSIKRACSIALVLTTSTALAGANTVLLKNNFVGEDKIAYAEVKEASSLNLLEIAGHSETVYVGEQYTVPTATLKISGSNTTLTSDNYVVRNPMGRKVTVDSDNKFTVDTVGNYTIEYSIVNGEKTYKASLNLKASISATTIEVVENTQRILPKYVYKSFAGNIYVPEVKVKDEDGNDFTDCKITTTVTSPSQNLIYIDSETGKLDFTKYITDVESGTTDEDSSRTLEQGTYTVTYLAETENGVFLNSTSQEFTVLSDEEFEKEYKKDYTLKFDYSKTINTSADIGETIELPTPVGKMGNETVPVYYTIEAYVYVDGKTIDVTSQTMDGNKFTAQKTYNVNEEVYTVTNGRYQFYYNVTDGLGKVAEKTGFEISGVKDTKKPDIVIADPYTPADVTDPEEVKDVAYKMQNNFENGKNVILKAFYAKDLSDKFENIELKRYLREDSQTSTSKDIYTDADQETEDIFAKDIVFNMTQDFRDNNFDETKMVDGDALLADGKLEDGSYTVYYEAKDSAGNVQTQHYSFTINSQFAFTKAPTVEFQDNFAKSVNSGDKIVFSSPVASDDDDDMLFTQVMYKYNDDDEWTVLEEKDSKYTIEVNKEGATSLTIRAKTENDAPMTDAEENADDDIANYEGHKYGYAEVEIDIKNVKDAQAPTEVKLDVQDGQSYVEGGDPVVLPTLTLEDDLVDYVNTSIYVTHVDGDSRLEFDVENATILRANNTYSLSGATFDPKLSGKYEVVYEIRDAGNHNLYIYYDIEVTPNTKPTDPKLELKVPEKLADGKLELGETLTLPIPDITGAGEGYEYRVNYKSDNVSADINNETFTPRKEGTYTIVYSLWVKKDGENLEEVVEQRKEMKIVVSDTTNPVIHLEWDKYVKPNYKKDPNKTILIPGFSIEDVSDFDAEKSKIVINGPDYTKTVLYKDIAKALDQYDTYQQEVAENKPVDQRTYNNAGDLAVVLDTDGLYTITYTAVDKSNNQNSVSVTKTFSVGDSVKPVLDIANDILPSEVKINSELSIDISKITVSDNIDTDLTYEDVRISLRNKTTGTPVNADENNPYMFYISTAGEYEMTFTVTDAAGNERIITRTFNVNEVSNNGVATNDIIVGIIITVAVLILAGSVIYLIVTKKKMNAYK